MNLITTTIRTYEEAPAAIVINDRTRGLVVRAALYRERLFARLCAGSLDRRLATGTAPETSPLLAVRANAIVRPAARHGLARNLQRILHRAAAPGSHRPVALSGSTCRNVLNAADELRLLVDRLRSPCPVSAQGMAMVKVLLTDGAGPLYYPAHASELPASVHEAIKALDGPVTP
jgi:hypothetical protein